MNKKIVLSFWLLIFSHNILPIYISKSCSEELSKLLDMPADTDQELYQQYANQELVPLLKEQIAKYHPETKPYFSADEKHFWHAYADFSINIPVTFIAQVIKHRIEQYKEYNESILNKISYAIYGFSKKYRLKKDVSFWQHLACFHHEATHIQLKHTQQKNNLHNNGSHGLDKEENNKFLELCRKHEWEADQGIPDHRLMLQSIIQFFEQSPSGENLDEEHWNNSTHPSDKDRAARFGQRLEILLKERAQSVNHTFGLDKLPKIHAPQNMPQPSKLLNIESEHYESILDFIGEYKHPHTI